ncbi:transmembrane protein 187 [Rhincodon typus]|uniref:transmembrane protein 187 n=1 Tax=Rhincodon typus TaxID=259920 RepID=UPI0009A26F4F|nr:transmembrane protein 187 [Rhincodon typus]
MAMLGPGGKAFLHIVLLCGLCLSVLSSGLLDRVYTELGYGHYAERPVSWLPRFLAMPCNCLVNLGYMGLGAYWLRRESAPSRGQAYRKAVFAWMAVVYGPVQWVRLSSQAQRAAVLDQWLTLPIFAWVPAWVTQLLRVRGALSPDWAWASSPLLTQAASVCSYGLALAHRRGFELALGIHVAAAVVSGLAAQSVLGDRASRRHLVLAIASCCGFVGLKLLDQPLAAWGLLPQPLSGHSCSKVCDILQFHHSFCFLEILARHKEEKLRPRGAGSVRPAP